MVVSFAPLDSFVKSVGGKHVGVICLATTTGPHEYEYNVAAASVFLLVRRAHSTLPRHGLLQRENNRHATETN